MLDFPAYTIWSLWLILVPIFVFAWIGMAMGDKLRGVKIENKEDHHNAKTALVSTPPLLALIVLSAFTPIVTGPLFWIGLVLISLAGVIYVLSIASFVTARRGLTTEGIYRLSRNPMYMAMSVVMVAFVFMAWSAVPLMGILLAVVALWNSATTHWMTRAEERFLESKYGQAYAVYKRSVPRYLLFVSRHKTNERM
jgi:protein-S-isoprenylcysteine O-methyltransferase Ste14